MHCFFLCVCTYALSTGHIVYVLLITEPIHIFRTSHLNKNEFFRTYWLFMILLGIKMFLNIIDIHRILYGIVRSSFISTREAWNILFMHRYSQRISYPPSPTMVSRIFFCLFLVTCIEVLINWLSNSYTNNI